MPGVVHRHLRPRQEGHVADRISGVVSLGPLAVAVVSPAFRSEPVRVAAAARNRPATRDDETAVPRHGPTDRSRDARDDPAAAEDRRRGLTFREAREGGVLRGNHHAPPGRAVGGGLFDDLRERERIGLQPAEFVGDGQVEETLAAQRLDSFGWQLSLPLGFVRQRPQRRRHDAGGFERERRIERPSGGSISGCSHRALLTPAG